MKGYVKRYTLYKWHFSCIFWQFWMVKHFPNYHETFVEVLIPFKLHDIVENYWWIRKGNSLSLKRLELPMMILNRSGMDTQPGEWWTWWEPPESLYKYHGETWFEMTTYFRLEKKVWKNLPQVLQKTCTKKIMWKTLPGVKSKRFLWVFLEGWLDWLMILLWLVVSFFKFLPLLGEMIQFD